MDKLRGQKVIGDTINVRFAHPFNGRDGEVLLWLPDIVAGAVATARGDADFQFLAPLEALVDEITIELQ